MKGLVDMDLFTVIFKINEIIRNMGSGTLLLNVLIISGILKTIGYKVGSDKNDFEK